MITIEIMLDDVVVDPQTVATSAEATQCVAKALALMELLQYEPRMRLRVTGDTTAASCRHHPLSPGTIGDPAMITLEVRVKNAVNLEPEIWEVSAQDSTMATDILRELLLLAENVPEPHLRVRVTGDTTAASCRHHPLAPGTIGDPRR